MALLRFAEVLPDVPEANAARETVERALRHALTITHATDTNPFAYPRQHVRMPDSAGQDQYFIGHHNESGYWWQGENARLGSLASAALAAQAVLTHDPSLCAALQDYTLGCLNWIFGFNPFDMCMMQGHGRNNPRYEPGFRNAPGGVCNGITAGLDDENDIDFRHPAETVPIHSWRWTEQWIPHGAWLLHALARLQG